MDFPVYVASDIHGAKLNLSVSYHPHTASVERFLHSTSLTFDVIAEHLQLGSLAPFATAYIYSDVLCQWDPLTSRAQLSPCCQIYVFRDDATAEAVGAIPDPLRPSHFFTPRLTTPQHDRSWTSDASPGPRPPVPLSCPAASSTPVRLASSRWVLPSRRSPSRARPAAATAATGTQPTARRFAVSPSPLQHPVPAPTRVTRPQHVDKATETEVCTAETAPAAHPRESTPSSAPSHRFRRRIMSPAPDRHTLPHGPSSALALPRAITTTTTTTAATSTPTALSPRLWPAWSASASVQHSTPLSRQPSSDRFGRDDVRIPRSWYDPSRHAPTSANAAAERADRVVGSRRPSLVSNVASVNGGSVPQSTWAAHNSRRSSAAVASWTPARNASAVASSPGYTRARSGRSGSILREERERVGARMHMSLGELRMSLQEEDRQLHRALGGAPPHPLLPAHATLQR